MKQRRGCPTTLTELRERITAAGYDIDDTTAGHRRVRRANGTFLMPLPSTPSDPSLKSTWRMFQRLKDRPPRTSTGRRRH